MERHEQSHHVVRSGTAYRKPGMAGLRSVGDYQGMTAFETQICYSLDGPWLTVAVALSNGAAQAAVTGALNVPDPWNRLPVACRVLEVGRSTRG